MLARVSTFAVEGVEARRVWVEADIRLGLPAFTVVGLADKAVREARERVRSAMVNSGYEFPQRRITVNLAPAYLRKVGPAFDLPLAVALLVASGQLEPEAIESCAIVGELSLTGEVRAGPRRARGRRGRAARRAAPARAPALAGARGRAGAGHRRRRDRLAGRRSSPPCAARPLRRIPPLRRPRASTSCSTSPTCAATTGSIPGLEVAAAGGHNLFLQGPPGTGKTMIARRMPSILPPLAPEEAIEVTRIQSVAGLRGAAGLVTERPVPRAPSHGLRRRPRRRRQPAPAGRGDARPSRRALPRRALRVRPPEPRGAAPAARGRPRHDRARPAGHGLPDPLHARRRLEPVPVRPRRRPAATAPRPTSRATAAASPARCWTASTS